MRPNPNGPFEIKIADCSERIHVLDIKSIISLTEYPEGQTLITLVNNWNCIVPMSINRIRKICGIHHRPLHS